MTSTKITERTKVKVINNVNGSASFVKVDGRLVRFSAQGSFQNVLVEDLMLLMATAPAMLTEGILLIPDKQIREYLGINTDNIIGYSEIDALLKEKPAVIKEKLSKTSSSNKREVATKAKKVSDDLTGGQVKVIEEESKLKITENI